MSVTSSPRKEGPCTAIPLHQESRPIFVTDYYSPSGLQVEPCGCARPCADNVIEVNVQQASADHVQAVMAKQAMQGLSYNPNERADIEHGLIQKHYQKDHRVCYHFCGPDVGSQARTNRMYHQKSLSRSALVSSRESHIAYISWVSDIARRACRSVAAPPRSWLEFGDTVLDSVVPETVQRVLLGPDDRPGFRAGSSRCTRDGSGRDSESASSFRDRRFRDPQTLLYRFQAANDNMFDGFRQRSTVKQYPAIEEDMDVRGGASAAARTLLHANAWIIQDYTRHSAKLCDLLDTRMLGSVGVVVKDKGRA
ncbi:hypothetical protein BDZ85DRAFT_299711 [Elsinoe ampelina]|uniref:Uncharacterized protein n=1 Tax=Elsinoe ampelina TaxID=302913 RepID=A0A6A6FXK9_9PEZI|nr:hypothetical protein BDZ85DRAFT_299711 [Elsinoe ampelina]